MQYSELKYHIIEKKYFLGFSIIIFSSIILGYLIFTGEEGISLFILRGLFFYLAIICFSITLIGYLVVNFHRCHSFFYSFLVSELMKKTMQICEILIETKAYKMKVPYNSYDAKIHSKPKPTNAVCIETNEYLLLFFSLHYLGLFQEVLKPFIFLKTKNKFHIETKSVNIIRDFELITTEQNRTIIFPNKHGIKKIIIPIETKNLS